MTMHVKGEGLKFPDGTEQTTAGVGGSGDGYTKEETDVLLNTKADVGISYTKDEVDVKIDTKADIGVSYTKAEDEIRLATKADVAETYTKSEVDALIYSFDAIPAGLISIWSGALDALPENWTLCDGTNGAPDLRDKFVVGSGSSYAVNATGGSKDAIVVTHNHSATSNVSDPGHVHSIPSGGETAQGVYTESSTQNQGPINTNGALTGITVSTSVNNAGSSGTNKNLPPYFALAYIMKL